MVWILEMFGFDLGFQKTGWSYHSVTVTGIKEIESMEIKRDKTEMNKDIELCLIKDEMNVFVLYLLKLLR
jgi:hypothetical protein